MSELFEEWEKLGLTGLPFPETEGQSGGRETKVEPCPPAGAGSDHQTDDEAGHSTRDEGTVDRG